LANLVEEPLLQGIRTQLTAYLRDKLNNSNINVFGVMQAIETKRVAYTNKEKFDYLAEKNPILLELKERLGLDTDY
jgi:DNA polymerase-3 subunit gamma/tau